MSDRIVIIGFDPGLKGGWSLMSTSNRISVFPMPVLDGQVDVADIRALLTACVKGPLITFHAYIEKAQAFPGITKLVCCKRCGLETHQRQAQGVVSTGTFMEGAGLIRGLLIGMGIEVTRIAAKEWQ